MSLFATAQHALHRRHAASPAKLPVKVLKLRKTLHCLKARDTCTVSSGELHRQQRSQPDAQGRERRAGGVRSYRGAAAGHGSECCHPAAACQICGNASQGLVTAADGAFAQCAMHLQEPFADVVATTLLAFAIGHICYSFSRLSDDCRACSHWLRCFAAISTLCPLVQALNQIQFAPPPPFVLACGNYLMHRLELFVNAPPGQGQPVDVSVISHIMTALSGFKFAPPAPLLTLVRLLPPVVVACSLACAQVLAMAESIHYVCASTQNSALCVTTVKCAGVQSGADADQVCRSCRHLRPARDICRCVLASQRHVLGRGTHHLCNAVQAQT
jgi:hypothetical protein